MGRVDEFQIEGRNFVYIDLSEFKSNEDFLRESAAIELVIAKYPEKSVYTITNIENVRFDTNSKEVVANYMRNNKPYVKSGVVIGLDGIKKVLVNMVLKMSGRTNMHFAFSKEQAIEWLLKQD